MDHEEDLVLKSKFKLKKIVAQLGAIRGRHTELVTVYVPAGANLHDIVATLRSEQSTAENIKSKPVRKNVVSALEKIMRHLSLYKKTPENGLGIFCGNVSEREGAADIDLWAIEPPEQIKTKLYWCDQTFVMEPLLEQVEEKEIYGIVCLDKNDADIALLKGKKIEPIAHFESIVPGKTRAGGQCLLPSTLVQLSSGEIIEIKDAHNPSSVKSADFGNFTFSDSPILDKWDTEKKVKYKIITKLPRTEIESSGDHTFFTWGDKIKEKPARELKAGDYLLIPEKIKVKGEMQALDPVCMYNSYKISPEGRSVIKETRKNNGLSQKHLAKRLNATQTAISVIELNKRGVRTEFLSEICKELSVDIEKFVRMHCTPNSEITLPNLLDEKMAQFLGYFAGDGSFEKERLSLHEKDEKTIRQYRLLTKTLFNCNTSLRFRNAKGYWILRIYGKPIVNFIRKEFTEIKAYNDTEIPKKILKSEDTVLASFLRGFFDAEGYVNMERGIGLGINNKKLAKQLQMSLLRFGILASLVEYDNRRNPYTKETRYTISITEKISIDNFREFIGFAVPYKAKLLDKVYRSKSSVSYVRRIAVSGRNIRKILEQNGMKTADFPKVTNFFRNERLMSKTVFLNSVLSEIKDPELYEKLKPVLDYNMVPVKIKKIEKTDMLENMVDISVKNRNFIANGLLVHNSSARFSRVREGMLNDWLKRIGEACNKIFEEHKEIKGIIVSGSGPIKEMFLKEDYLHGQVKQKVIGIVDTSYTGDQGLQETLVRGEDLLKEADITKEKKLLQHFFTELQKPHGLGIYGIETVLKILRQGAVDMVILYENLDMKFVELECQCGQSIMFVDDFHKNKQRCPQCGILKRVLGEKDIIEFFEEEVKNFGTKLTIVSSDTREGDQFRQLGGIGGILRYNV